MLYSKNKNITSCISTSILGLLCSFKISIGGEIYFGEIIAIITILFHFKKLKVPYILRPMIVFIFIWVIFQFISDVIINNTEISNTIKGCGAPLLLIITIIAYINFFKNCTYLIPYFFLGVVIGKYLFIVLFNNLYYLINPWKWGLGSFLLMCFLIYYSYWKKNKGILLLLIFSILFSAYSLIQSSRSIAGIFLISTFFYIMLPTINRISLFNEIKKSSGGIIMLLIFSIGLVYLLNILLGFVFLSDILLNNLSDKDALKYSTQASSSLGVILAGRSELLISLEAFFDKPLFGHGSWPKNSDYIYRYVTLKNTLGASSQDIDSSLANIQSELIPTHSYLMGALVWGGIFSGLFWLNMFYKLFERLIKNGSQLSLLIIYLSILLLWNILFSPFGASARWFSGIAIWLIFFTQPTYTKSTRVSK